MLPADEVEQVTSEDGWFRFCLTRRPVERLWSSWQSKLLLREPDFLGWYGTAQWFTRAPKELPKKGLPPSTPLPRTSKASLPLSTRTRSFIPPTTTGHRYLLRSDVFPYSEIGHVKTVAVTRGRLERHLRAQGRRGTLDLKRLNATLLPRTLIRDPKLLRLMEKIYADDMACHDAGGYGRLHVANDYELLVCLFLTIRFVHIPSAGLRQFYNLNRSAIPDVRRNEIQRIVRFVANHY